MSTVLDLISAIISIIGTLAELDKDFLQKNYLEGDFMIFIFVSINVMGLWCGLGM